VRRTIVIYKNPPIRIKTAEVVKIKGQSLKGRNFTLKPVNRETNANPIKPNEDTKYTAVETWF